MKVVKTKLQSIEKIEKTVNSINVKVCDLEEKMKSMDTRVTETEKSCQFSAAESESNEKELKAAKEEIKNLKKQCNDFEAAAKSLQKQCDELDMDLIDVQGRSMKQNLLFYGIAEGGEKEDCGEAAKEVLRSVLKIPNAGDNLFDNVHRVGQFSAGKVRPIVVKFHYYTDREKIRQAAFAAADEMKAANLGIGAQIPKKVRDARKPLYPIMKKAKEDGKTVKFAGKKMFINGKEYVSGPTGTA